LQKEAMQMMRTPSRNTRLLVAVVLAGWLSTGALAPLAGAANPNGSRIVFEGDRFSPWGLAAMAADGSGVIDLQAPIGAADASWSPDGKRIAFELDTSGAGDLAIFVADADGSNLQQLTDSSGRDYWPDWFPDGKRIAFTSFRSGVPNIWVMNADGSEAHAVTDDPVAGGFQPNVSSSGREIVFMRGAEFEPPTIWVVNTDGSNLRQVTAPGPYADLDPQWSPDGRRIVFSSNRTGAYEIFVIDADGGNPVQLTASPGSDFNPTFSPDGRQIAWWKLRGGQGDIWIMNADGSDPVNITNSPGFEGFPDWHQGHLKAK
jgi:Tol biopolymer transport system component